MTTTPLRPLPEHILRMHELDDVWRAPGPGERLERARALAPRFRERLLASGRVVGVRTFDTAMLPYPTPFAFAGAARSPLPFIAMTNRVNVVQFEDDDRKVRTLLFNPTDAPRAAKTPFFARMRASMGESLGARVNAALERPAPVTRLSSLGLRPEDVDYIAFDHMHTQDVRALLGTAPSKDGEGLRAVFPRAKFLIWQPELDIFRALHPLQRPWYLPDAVRHVPADRFVVCDSDVLLGKGVALVRTPGHTVGNWSLALHTDNGVWTVSENGVSADSYAPEASAIAGLRRYARSERVEVVLNSNTLEGRNEQYTSMVLEKSIADRCRSNPAFCQHFPSSELTATPLTPGLSPTYRHGGIESGGIRKPS